MESHVFEAIKEINFKETLKWKIKWLEYLIQEDLQVT